MAPFALRKTPQPGQSKAGSLQAISLAAIRLLASLTGTLLLAVMLSGCQTGQAAEGAPTPTSTSFANPLTTPPTVRVTPTQSPTPVPSLTPRPERPSPTPQPSPTNPAQACLQEPGRVVLENLRSDQLKLPMEVRIYLPACYDVLPETRFPVLYLIHGMNYTEEQWQNLGVVEAADRLIRTHQAAPFLIIMPRDRLWKEPSETPFDEVFIDELVPWVDDQYRTLTDRQQRAVGGLSRGGMWALHFGINHWDLFGAVGLHSSPVFWEDARGLVGKLDAIPPDKLPRLFLDIGEKDYLISSNRWLVKTLDQENIPHEYYLFPGYHEEAYWAAHVEEYLRWYVSSW